MTQDKLSLHILSINGCSFRGCPSISRILCCKVKWKQKRVKKGFFSRSNSYQQTQLHCSLGILRFHQRCRSCKNLSSSDEISNGYYTERHCFARKIWQNHASVQCVCTLAGQGMEWFVANLSPLCEVTNTGETRNIQLVSTGATTLLLKLGKGCSNGCRVVRSSVSFPVRWRRNCVVDTLSRISLGEIKTRIAFGASWVEIRYISTTTRHKRTKTSLGYCPFPPAIIRYSGQTTFPFSLIPTQKIGGHTVLTLATCSPPKKIGQLRTYGLAAHKIGVFTRRTQNRYPPDICPVCPVRPSGQIRELNSLAAVFSPWSFLFFCEIKCLPVCAVHWRRIQNWHGLQLRGSPFAILDQKPVNFYSSIPPIKSLHS